MVYKCCAPTCRAIESKRKAKGGGREFKIAKGRGGGMNDSLQKQV